MCVEELLRNEIVINWPMKILCRPDCRGICRQCGQDLNTGTCDCDTFVPDPRMAVIKDIFNGTPATFKKQNCKDNFSIPYEKTKVYDKRRV